MPIIIEAQPGVPITPDAGSAPPGTPATTAPVTIMPQAAPASMDAPAMTLAPAGGTAPAAPALDGTASGSSLPDADAGSLPDGDAGSADADGHADITGSTSMTLALMEAVASYMDEAADWGAQSTATLMTMIRLWTTNALIEVAPRLTVSPLQAMPGTSGLAYATPLLHATLAGGALEAFDGQCAALERAGASRFRSVRHRLLQMRRLDVAGGDRLPWGLGDASAALMALDAGLFQARGTHAPKVRRMLLGLMDRDGVNAQVLFRQSASVINAGMAANTDVLWTMYEPSPIPMTMDMVGQGVRMPMDEPAYRTVMETAVRDMLAQQDDPDVRALIPKARALAADAWADPDCLASTIYTVDDLLDVHGPCPPIVVDQARLVFGVARSMAVDRLDPGTIYRVVSGTVPGGAA